jgi:hypothetical protein
MSDPVTMQDVLKSIPMRSLFPDDWRATLLITAPSQKTLELIEQMIRRAWLAGVATGLEKATAIYRPNELFANINMMLDGKRSAVNAAGSADLGAGSHEAMAELNRAREEALRWLDQQ